MLNAAAADEDCVRDGGAAGCHRGRRIRSLYVGLGHVLLLVVGAVIVVPL